MNTVSILILSMFAADSARFDPHGQYPIPCRSDVINGHRGTDGALWYAVSLLLHTTALSIRYLNLISRWWRLLLGQTFDQRRQKSSPWGRLAPTASIPEYWFRHNHATTSKEEEEEGQEHRQRCKSCIRSKPWPSTDTACAGTWSAERDRKE